MQPISQRVELETRATSEFEIDAPLPEDMGYCRVVHGFLSDAEWRDFWQ